MFEATKSMFDYGFGFFMLVDIINVTVIYLLFVWQLESTIKYIENCEMFVGKSK